MQHEIFLNPTPERLARLIRSAQIISTDCDPIPARWGRAEKVRQCKRELLIAEIEWAESLQPRDAGAGAIAAGFLAAYAFPTLAGALAEFLGRQEPWTLEGLEAVVEDALRRGGGLFPPSPGETPAA